jgi:predicted dehydrogenase
VTDPLRWGIVGPGRIADKVTADFVHVDGAAPVAVASRDRGRAEAFAARHGIERVHGSYREIIDDPDVDVLYLATPHPMHHATALAAIDAGKALLVEKAFTATVAGAVEVIERARAAGVFVMEAMWTRFLPHVAALHEVVDSGEIGQVVNVTADHGQWFAFDAAHRLFDPALAGGALLDLGVYPVSFAHDFLGAPASVNAVGTLTETQVDAQGAMILNYPGDVQATLHTTLLARTPTVAAVSGTEGFVRVDGSFYRPTSFTVERRGADPRTSSFVEPHGLHHEAVEVAIRVAEGATESPRMSWQDTLDVLGTMDEVRAQIGLTYPGEVPRS